MKKYMVISKIGNFSANEERQFDNLDDARQFKYLLTVSEKYARCNYYIVEVLE